MAKFLNGRPGFINGEQSSAGEFISGRQLLGLDIAGVADVRPLAQTLGVLQGPHAIPRDFSYYGPDKPLLNVAQGPAVETAALPAAAPSGTTLRSGNFESVLTARHVVTDPRTESLGLCGGCATCANSGKDFNGYELHAGGHGAITDSLPFETADEGTLTVTVGGSVSGVIDIDGDEDVIEVSLVAGQTYSVYLYGYGPNAVADTFLSVFAPGGSLVNQDDDGGLGLYSLITFTASATGVYQIVAAAFDNGPGFPGTGDYTVHVEQQGTDSVPQNPPSAVVANLGLNYGFLETSGDDDVYQVTLTAGLIYTFEVAGGADYNTSWSAVPTGELDTIIRIYNSAGVQIYSNDDIDFPDDISSAVGFIAETSGTYYVKVEAYSGQTGGYVLEITQTDLSTLDPLDAIDWGGPGNVVDNSDTLLIYFATAGQTFDGVTSLGWNPYEQGQALAAFQTYSQFADLTFAITTNQAEADFTLVTTSSTEFLGYFNPPGTVNAGVGVFATNAGTGWDSTGAAGSLEPGGYGWITLIHEFGHALGMAHPHDNGGGSTIIPGVSGPFGSYGIFDLNQGVYTTMSYNDGWQLHPDVDANGFPVPDTLDYGYQATPMAFDIALMQIKYGSVAHNTGNDVYLLGDANVAGTYYQAIWDTGGIDEIAYVGTRDAIIDLTAATLDYSATGAGVISWVEGIFGGYTIAAGVTIENATGGSGDDILVGNSVANILTGNDGNDTFVGKEGDDEIFGGDGSDTVVYLGNQADYTITAIVGGWTVTDDNIADGDEGTDTIHDITFLQFADGTVNLEDAPGNQAPTLTGLATDVTFNEQDVNGGPQLIDSNVNFQDSDGNFNGGTLVVSGLLAEDVVGIRNQGNLPGQVGVSGANVSYGGVLIGTIAGGNGTTLTVTFNGLATTLAVEAVIENLTYANASNSPTADRQFLLDVTDDEGASLVTPPAFEFLAPSPLDGLTVTVGANTHGSYPTFLDVDGDGDLDLIAGGQNGTFLYFRNDAGTFVSATSPITFDVGSYSTPVAIDIDMDGDLDIVSSGNNGQIFTFRNNGGGSFTQLTGVNNPFNGIDIGSFGGAGASDFDGDGDTDLFVGTSTGTITAFRNNGNGTFTQLTGVNNPFNGIDVGSYANPSFFDYDGDGDEDALVGNITGSILAYTNNGGVFTAAPAFDNFVGDGLIGPTPQLAFVDLDGDGDLDAVAGSYYGDFLVFENTQTSGVTIDIHVLAQNDAPSGTSGSATILENTSYTFAEADFGFSDVLEGDDFAGVVITTLPGQGTLLLNGVAVTAGQFVTAADITGGLLTYEPDADENGANYASFTFQVRDDGGTANGGLDTDPTPNTFSFAVTPDNFPPVLTDLASSVTFLENTVNATPQLLDVDVTLTDDNGFANGSVVVSGLLAEDRVGLFNEGTGAGQIGVSGADVTYEGVVIGTYSGGVGNDFTVSLNAAATTAAVEALLEHLTYGNVSDDPTPSRTLSIQVYDHEGLGLPSGGAFNELTGASNPFAAVIGAGNGTIPTFVDVDGDGDLDLVVGAQYGYLQTFLNDGAGNFTEVTGAANPLDFVAGFGTYTAPAAIDIDGDGDVDLVVGTNYGDLLILENDGAGGWSYGGFLPGSDIGSFSTPTVVDLDNDGLDDIIVGELNGNLNYFHNNGGGSFSLLTGANNPLNSILVDYFSAAGFVDLDGDGDLDVVVGDYYGGLTAFTNEGGTFVPAANNPFSGFTFSSIPAFTFVDLDGDGDLDGVAGSFDGDIRYFENVSSAGAEIVVNVTPENDIFPVELYDENDVLVATYATIQAAVDAASNGYRISILDGTYVEQVVVNGIDDLTIEAAPGANVIIQAPDTLVVTGAHAATHNGGANVYGILTVIDSANISINGIDIDGAGNGDSVPTTGENFAGVFFRNSSGELIGVDIYGVHSPYPGGTTADGYPELLGVQHGTGVVVDNDTLLSFIMSGGSISDFQKNAGRFWEADLDISGVTVTGSGAQTTGPAQNGFVIDSGTGSISGNTLTDIGYAGPVFTYSVIIYVRGSNGLDVTNNIIDGTNDATLDARVLGIAYYDDNAANNGGSITGNIISNVDTGVDAEGDLGAPVIIINGNVVTNVDFTDSIFPAGLYFEPNASSTLNYVIQGTDVTDYIYGAAGNDTFFGLDGDDTLEGLGGNDTLNGGLGADTMIGGLGNDTYYVDQLGDSVIELPGEGNDRIITSISYALAANLSIETLEAAAGTDPLNLTGNSLNNTIIGNAGNNILHGGGGAGDVLIGLGGDDIYFTDVASTQIVEVNGQGNDRLYTSVSYTLGGNASIELLSTNNYAATTAINLTGNYMAQTVAGNAGNNILNGGGGADILVGFGGNDIYYIDVATVQVVEGAGGGNDAIYTSVSYTLGGNAQVETLSANSYVATTAINLTGNNFAQTIVGNAGNNIINGGGGADILAGRGGNDIYFVDLASVQVYENANEGNDQLYTSVSYTLNGGAEIELLSANSYAATSAINLTGNSYAQTVVGNAGNNIINGGGGADTLYGLGGADTFVFNTALGGGNVDLLADFNPVDDTIALDDAVFVGIGGLGVLAGSAFVTGAAAGDADDRIIYNSVTGQLFFDSDGTGSNAAILFATVNPGTVLTASDFIII